MADDIEESDSDWEDLRELICHVMIFDWPATVSFAIDQCAERNMGDDL